MIRYFDTSALVKLLVAESESNVVRRLFRESTARVVHDIAYVEMHSAVSRMVRTRAIVRDVVSDIRERIDSLWSLLDRVRIDEALLREAAALTANHPLAAYDALYLASVLRVRVNVGHEQLDFVCFDAALRTAAETEGVTLRPDD